MEGKWYFFLTRFNSRSFRPYATIFVDDILSLGAQKELWSDALCKLPYFLSLVHLASRFIQFTSTLLFFFISVKLARYNVTRDWWSGKKTRQVKKDE